MGEPLAAGDRGLRLAGVAALSAARVPAAPQLAR